MSYNDDYEDYEEVFENDGSENGSENIHDIISDGEFEEVFEEDTPEQAASDRKNNAEYYLGVAAAVERDRNAKYSDEEIITEPKSPSATYTATNVTWTYKNKDIPPDINKELLEIIEYIECPINDDKTPIDIVQGKNMWYFKGFSQKCFVEYTVYLESKTCNIDIFRCDHHVSDLIPPGSGRCLLLKLLQTQINENQIEKVTITAKPLIYESEYEGKSDEEIEEYENARNIHLRKYYNDIGFMPKTIISDTTSNDNEFIAPIEQVIYNILIYKKSPIEIDEINRNLKSDLVETAGGYKKARKTKRKHKKTKRKTKQRIYKKTKRRLKRRQTKKKK
jgi:hypothetical protein